MALAIQFGYLHVGRSYLHLYLTVQRQAGPDRSGFVRFGGVVAPREIMGLL